MTDTTCVKEVIVLAPNEVPEPPSLGYKTKGICEPAVFPGYYAINALIHMPMTGDVMVNGQADQEHHCDFGRYPSPYLGNWNKPNRIWRDYLSATNRLAYPDSIVRLSNAVARQVASIHKNKNCFYRKYTHELEINQSKASKFTFTLSDSNTLISGGDIVCSLIPDFLAGASTGNVSFDEFINNISSNSWFVVENNSPFIGKKMKELSNFLEFQCEWHPCYLFKMKKIGPYGVQRKLPMNKIFCDPLPLP